MLLPLAIKKRASCPAHQALNSSPTDPGMGLCPPLSFILLSIRSNFVVAIVPVPRFTAYNYTTPPRCGQNKGKEPSRVGDILDLQRHRPFQAVRPAQPRHLHPAQVVPGQLQRALAADFGPRIIREGREAVDLVLYLSPLRLFNRCANPCPPSLDFCASWGIIAV